MVQPPLQRLSQNKHLSLLSTAVRQTLSQEQPSPQNPEQEHGESVVQLYEKHQGKTSMQAHNTKLLTVKEEEEGQQKTCNCRRSRKEKCPLKGECIQKDTIYHATIKTEKEERKYVGSTVNFKRRYYGHTASFKWESKRHNTALSGYVWDNQLGPDPDIEWSILQHAPAYKLGNRTCACA